MPQLAGVFKKEGFKKKEAEISAVKALIVKQTNRFRKGEGLEPVGPNKALNKTSQRFADFMARTKKFGHTADGRLPSERVQAQGYQYCIVSENIAYQFRSRDQYGRTGKDFRHRMGKSPRNTARIWWIPMSWK